MDRSNDSNKQMQILRSGYQVKIPVIRSYGEDFDQQKTFDVYGPKIIASRFSFGDEALESRCITINMDRFSTREMPLSLDDEFYNRATELQNRLLGWKFKNHFKKHSLKQSRIDGLNSRYQQLTQALLSFVEDEAHAQKIIEYVRVLNEDINARRGVDWESEIAREILILRSEGNVQPRVSEIAVRVNKIEAEFKEQLSNRKTGYYISRRLRLKTERRRDGYELVDNESNRKKLDFWREKIGITVPDSQICERVNVVNIAVEEGTIDPEKDLPKW
jgi:hypothetical protein